MNIEDAKHLIQRHLSDGLVLVVGSGLSCAEGLPSMAELGNALCTHLPSRLTSETKKQWNSISDDIAINGLEATLLAHDISPDLESEIVCVVAREIREKETEILGGCIAGTNELRLTRLLPKLVKPAAGLPIVTTNYDRLIEFAAESVGYGADTMFVGDYAATLDPQKSRLRFTERLAQAGKRVRLTQRTKVSIFKPHGSLSWYASPSGPKQSNLYLSDQPLIITPGKNKYKNGYSSPFDIHRDRANEAIDAASRILVIGYGFNDDHLETHLSQRIRDGIPTILLTRDVSPVASTLALTYPNFAAFSLGKTNGPLGTDVIVNCEISHLPGVCFWDVNHLVTEVLSP